MELLIECFKIRGQLEEAQAAKQWLRLHGLLTAEVTTPAQASLESCRSEGQNHGIGEDRGSSKGGVYVPNVTVRNNPLVRNTGQDVILNCIKCGLELKSSWIFEHRGKVSTLAPTAGHSACGVK
ncbi:unnamed protein product [Polarella glacialis]|nr:unnamed protein product [Polarella glacialis]